MTRAAAIGALFWEQWRLTRVEAAQRLALGLVAGAAALVLTDRGVTNAFWVLIFAHSFIWFSIAKLNGGRFLDGYKPGFPLYLLYTRPVPTAVFVGVAMAYDAISCVVLYLVSAVLLELVFGQPLPLFSVTLWMVVAHLSYACVQYSTSNRIVQWVGSFAIGFPLLFLLLDRVETPLRVEFSPVENAVLVLLGVMSVVLTVAGVARQRRGDAVATVSRPEGSGGYPGWLINLFRFPCPTSSATRAQVWFELKSSGVPALTIGLSVALLVFLLFAIGIPMAQLRPFAVGSALFLAPTVVLVLLGGNAFGIRRRQGRSYASAFEITQAYGTAQQAGLKVLVRTACVLAALLAIGVSVWTSSSLMGVWGPWMMEGKDATAELLKLRHEIGADTGGLPGYVHVAFAVITFVAVAVMIAFRAAFTALMARYPRRLLVAGFLLTLWCFAFVLLSLAVRNGIASKIMAIAAILATVWIVAAAMVLATIYLFWIGFAERALTPHYVGGALVITLAFGAAWLAVLHAAGVPLSSMAATDAARILWLMLLPLMASVLAPWSLGRVRHT